MSDVGSIRPGSNGSRWAWAVAVLLTLAHLTWVPSSLFPVFPDFDASGYLTAATVFAERGEGRRPEESPLQFVGVHWFPAKIGGYVSRYPPGFPLLLAAFLRVGGMPAALAVNPLLSSVALLSLFILCRRYVRDHMALLCLVLLAVNPLANGQAVHVDSHSAAMTCLLGAVLVLDRWSRAPRVVVAAAGGLLLGLLVTIRYPEAVFALGVFVFAVLCLWRTSRAEWQVLAMIAGALLPVASLLGRNQSLFGAWWRTGYAFSLEQTAFSVADLNNHLGSYVYDLWQVTLLALPLGIIGIAVLVRERGTRPIGALIAISVVALFITYASYYWRMVVGDSMPIRFLLPIVPLLLFSTAVAVERIRSSRPLLGRGVIALLAAQAILQVGHSRQRMASAGEWSAPGLELYRGIEQRAAAGSIIVGELPVATSLEAAGKWRLADGDFIARLCKPRLSFTPPPMPNPLTGRSSAAARIYEPLDCESRRRRAFDDLEAWAGAETPVYVVARETLRDLPGNWKETGRIAMSRPLRSTNDERASPDVLSIFQLVR